MVFLRLKEFLDAKGLAIAELAQITGISEDVVQRYVQGPVKLTQEVAYDLRKIASKLNIPAVNLIRSVEKEPGIRLKILEKAKSKGLSFSQLSEKSGIHPLFLVIYGTQVLLKEKWEEKQTQENIYRIAAVLETSPEDLVVIEDPPITQLRINNFLKEKGLSLKELSLLYDVPFEALNLLVSQPFDLSATEITDVFVFATVCEIFGCPWPCRCHRR